MATFEELENSGVITEVVFDEAFVDDETPFVRLSFAAWGQNHFYEATGNTFGDACRAAISMAMEELFS